MKNRSDNTQLWGIYHLDREYARELGDPLRTVIEASTKELAEQEANVSASRLPGHIPSRPKQWHKRSGCQSGNLIPSQ